MILLFLWGFACVLLLHSAALGAETPPQAPAAKLISLDPVGKDYLRVLGGPPETVTMRSGVVVLAPGKSVGKHSTKDNEEIVVILEGEGTMLITGGKPLPLKVGWAAYGPPQTEHDVVNTGTGTLKYIYIVAKAK